MEEATQERPVSIRGILYVPHGTDEAALEADRHWGVNGVVFMSEGESIWGPGGIIDQVEAEAADV